MSGMSKIERAVFDTNVLISAYLWPGTPRHALELVRAGAVELLSATPAVEELVRVFGYTKFGLTPKEIAPFVDDLLSLAEIVVPVNVEMVSDDPSDNVFLGIAVQGNCQVIVSGDRHLLDLERFRGIRIITASEFVRIVRGR
ncbi:MAG: putative toxin-antitoxin system toxin component, PIN family [Nitrospira sp. LK70]|nr:putative toxin-antitoxin system toxin component, PIN family [Nitrospira sp. LK70]